MATSRKPLKVFKPIYVFIMQLERRVLYNSLRMNWLSNKMLKVEPWQVEDYRLLSLDVLFERLASYQIILDKQTFLLYAENVDSPEDLTDELLLETPFDHPVQDEIYLLIFEIWRRLVNDRKCLTIFLDELDHQIFLYDNGKSQEEIQDVLEELSLVLDENIDSGVDPHAIFQTICSACANDLESFLYDFISEQIENENELYASELLDDFSDYVTEVKWFEFLKARIQAVDDRVSANQSLRTILHAHAKEKDLEFNLEILSFIVKSGEHDLFVDLIKKSVPLLEIEDDFIDLATLSIDYFERLDRDREKKLLEKILDSRKKISPHAKCTQSDPQIKEFLKIIEGF